ncbi:MAG: helix-turn-helix transcriptional regulator [Clostridia bacterium]|nr:helix-turn-helix transcriptional regulator [Clostridia bacterium]
MMNLGEKIYELRSENNMSQGDLADKLDVSRQSVSKWENNTAVPDLDKLIKLCDIFEISLDELTGREKIERNIVLTETQKPTITPNKVAGFVFLGITLLGAIILLVTAPMALYLCIPLLLCTIICFNVKKYAWYWCSWIIYLLMELYLGTGFAWEILHIINAVFLVVMTILNIVYMKNVSSLTNKKRKTLLVLSLVVLLICISCIFLTASLPSVDDWMDWLFSLMRTGVTASIGMSIYHIIGLVREKRQKK